LILNKVWISHNNLRNIHLVLQTIDDLYMSYRSYTGRRSYNFVKNVDEVITSSDKIDEVITSSYICDEVITSSCDIDEVITSPITVIEVTTLTEI